MGRYNDDVKVVLLTGNYKGEVVYMRKDAAEAGLNSGSMRLPRDGEVTKAEYIRAQELRPAERLGPMHPAAQAPAPQELKAKPDVPKKVKRTLSLGKKRT